MNDGTAMTDGVHTETSVNIYPPKDRKPITRQQISQIRQATTPSSASSGGSSGGGGGY